MDSQDPMHVAALAEANDLINRLRERCVRLHAEVLIRDQRLAELQTEAKGDRP